MVNKVYQQPPRVAIYLGIAYPTNAFVPWGQPNWSNVLSYGGYFVNNTGGYGGTPLEEHYVYLEDLEDPEDL